MAIQFDDTNGKSLEVLKKKKYIDPSSSSEQHQHDMNTE